MSQLAGLSKYCGEENLGSLIRIRYAPTHWIYPPSFTELLSLSNYSVMHHVIFSTGSWLEAYLLPKGKSWTEGQRRTQQGSIFSESIRGILPKMKPTVSGEFYAMSHLRFVLLITDQNGFDWLAGTLEQPMEFKVRGKTGSDLAGANNYQIEWKAQLAKMVPGYAPVF